MKNIIRILIFIMCRLNENNLTKKPLNIEQNLYLVTGRIAIHLKVEI